MRARARFVLPSFCGWFTTYHLPTAAPFALVRWFCIFLCLLLPVRISVPPFWFATTTLSLLLRVRALYTVAVHARARADSPRFTAHYWFTTTNIAPLLVYSHIALPVGSSAALDETPRRMPFLAAIV